MNAIQTFTISLNNDFHPSISLVEMSNFVETILGEHFIKTNMSSKHIISYFSKENTSIQLHEKGQNTFLFILQSETDQIVSGLITYLEEVFEDTAWELS